MANKWIPMASKKSGRTSLKLSFSEKSMIHIPFKVSLNFERNTFGSWRGFQKNKF